MSEVTPERVQELRESAQVAIDTGVVGPFFSGVLAALAEVDRLRAKLQMPCGSCHPCTQWANQTWVNAGVNLPHLYEWQEIQARIAAGLALADQWAAVDGVDQRAATLHAVADRLRAVLGKPDKP